MKPCTQQLRCQRLGATERILDHHDGAQRFLTGAFTRP
jgi:hypothetical protein